MKRVIHYTLLAKSVPEFDKRDGKLYTCSLGYCPELGLIRVYPLPIVGMNKWHTYRITVEKNKRDSRQESWKLSSYARHEDWVGFSQDCEPLGLCNRVKMVQYLFSHQSPSIGFLNEKRKSIGVICSDSVKPFWEGNERFVNTAQVGMFDDVELADFTKYTKATREKQARIIFRDEDGAHDLQLNEWQYFEYQRKHGANMDAFRFMDNGGRNLMLLGNLLQYQNAWMVLSVMPLPKRPSIQSQPTIFTMNFSHPNG